MDIVRLIIILAVIGFIVFLVNAKAPIDPIFKQLISLVAIVGALLFILRAFGIF